MIPMRFLELVGDTVSGHWHAFQKTQREFFAREAKVVHADKEWIEALHKPFFTDLIKVVGDDVPVETVLPPLFHASLMANLS